MHGVFWSRMDCRLAVSLHPHDHNNHGVSGLFDVLNFHCSVSISDKLDSLDFWKTQYTLNSVCLNCHNGCVLSPPFLSREKEPTPPRSHQCLSLLFSLDCFLISLCHWPSCGQQAGWVSVLLSFYCPSVWTPFLSVLHCSVSDKLMFTHSVFVTVSLYLMKRGGKECLCCCLCSLCSLVFGCPHCLGFIGFAPLCILAWICITKGGSVLSDATVNQWVSVVWCNSEC